MNGVRRGGWVATALALTASTWAAGSTEGGRLRAVGPPAGPGPQNVMVIVLDDVGTDLIGAYERVEVARGREPGWPAETPAIDQLLAAEGVTFECAWTAPKCSPTRAQILTGRYPMNSGIGSIVRVTPFVGERNPGLYPETQLLPQQIRAAQPQYASAAVGKWHLGDIGQLEEDAGHALGQPHGAWFDYFAGSRFNLEEAGANTGANTYFSWRKTFASANGIATPCGAPGLPCSIDVAAPPVRNYATVDTAEDALALIASLPEPWFLYVSFNAVHAPFHLPPPGVPEAPCLPSAGSACDASSNVANAVVRSRCMMRALDQQIGRLACAVNSANTTIVLVGDNGTPQSAIAAPFNRLHGKGTLYEGGVRVPLIVRSPFVAPARRGAVESRPVSSVDIHATVLELVGAPSPAPDTDALSLLAYLTSSNAPTLRYVNYSEGFYPNFRALPGGGPPAAYVCNFHNQTVRDARFKLIRRTSRDHSNTSVITVREEFYDLLKGGPPDTSVSPPVPTPDWFEANDLLASGAPLGGAARQAYLWLSQVLDERYPSLVR